MPRAGLGPASVTEAAATLIDEIGFENLSMGRKAKWPELIPAHRHPPHCATAGLTLSHLHG